MRKRVIRLTGPGRPAFEIISYGRAGPSAPGRFSRQSFGKLCGQSVTCRKLW
jgi:hypothetical protein